MTNYPTSLDSLVNPSSTDTTAAVDHAAQHANVNDAVEALEAKLGIGSSTAASNKLLRGTGAGASAWDKDAPTGTIVGTTDTQTLTNKTLTSPTINTAIINNPTLNTNTIAEYTAAAGVTIDGLLIKDSKLATNNSVVASNITAGILTNAMLSAATGEPGAAWSSWTPAITAVSGSITSSSVANNKYQQIGKTTLFTLDITIVNAGTGSGLVFTLPPVAAKNTSGMLVFGREDAAVGSMVQGKMSSATTCTLSTYNNTNVCVTGYILRLAGFYEAS